MTEEDWRSTASVEALQMRARLLAEIREFFTARHVLEVETPLLSRAMGTDPHLHALDTQYHPPDAPASSKLYLQTSPEFAMKRLLACGSGAIYQIGKAFRDGESGSRHNPEFTLLEWYRPGFDEHHLMDEVAALISQVTGISSFSRKSYRELFRQHLDLDPHTATAGELEEVALGKVDTGMKNESVDVWLDLLFSHVIEPALEGAVFIHDYPAGQAALAQIGEDETGQPVARRFELIIGGLEIANGYRELADAVEQETRFQRDLEIRGQRGLPRYPIDRQFLKALQHGIPECAGVALGIDRLLMVLLNSTSIADVLAFPLDRS